MEIGRNAFNRVERRMSPLGHALAGVILTHANFGAHLDSQGNTVKSNLEIKKMSMQERFLQKCVHLM